MKIEIQLPDETVNALKKTMKRVHIPAADVGKVIASALSPEGINTGCIASIAECYVYPDRATAEKAVSTIGNNHHGNAVIHVTYRDRRGKVVTYGYPNPYGKKFRAQLAKSDKAKSENAGESAQSFVRQIECYRNSLGLALNYLSPVEVSDFRRKVKRMHRTAKGVAA